MDFRCKEEITLTFKTISMNTEFLDLPENGNQQATDANQDASQKEVQISSPRIDRPEGPFEHSGETSGWTKEEAAEKEAVEKEKA